MLGKCFFVIVAVSLVFSLVTGNVTALAGAAIDGAARAVEIVLSLTGMMCLWCGIMNVFKESGLIEKLSRLLSPLFRLIFPNAFKNGTAKEEITFAVSANLLGIGNAATPFALSAMKKMDDEAKSPYATDDMIMLACLACSPFNILPTTLIALRRAAGSAVPYRIIVPVWICSGVCALLTVILCRLFAAASPVPVTHAQKNSRGKVGLSPRSAEKAAVSREAKPITKSADKGKRVSW